MSKLLLLSICAILALILTLQLRTNSILQPNPTFGSSSPHRRLFSSYGLQGWKFFKPKNDPRTVNLKDDTIIDDATTLPFLTPMHVCGRVAPIPHDIDMHINQKYAACPLLNKPPETTTLLLLEGVETFGRTGNNLIEFLHSIQFGRDHNAVVGIMQGSWPTHLITNMWMAVQDGDMAAWRVFLETSFCVKLIDSYAETEQYKKVIRMETRDLFVYKNYGLLNQYVEFQGYIIRTLYRSYNNGTGLNMRRKPVGDMCSVLDAIFGSEKNSAVYSVVHSRSLEGDPGLRLLGRIARNIGSDPVAALDMEPEYVKAILAPRGMLDHPILFITDHQRPEILEKLLADPEIGPNIHLIPDEASWVGGDITVAVMANVFIGLPASTFSGFIAKSRVALGFDATYLFRKKNKAGEWVDACDEHCIFDKHVMRSMA